MERVLRYRAGIAAVCITPDEPLWLAGYASRTAPARGKISDLYARALALEDGAGQRFVIVSAEVIAITPLIADRVGTAAQERHGLARPQLLLTATHTHYGPEFRPEKQPFFNIPAEYAVKFAEVTEKLVGAMTNAIDRALECLEPVRLRVRKTSAGFAHNRRRHGVVAGTPSTDDIVDHNVPVLDCVDAAGKRKAIVFGYACHNTTIPPEDLRYCGDWAGFACQALQENNSAATVLFIPGAGADQDPEPRGSVDQSRRHGQDMARVVQTSLDSSGVEITGPIRAEWEDVPLALVPVTREGLGAMLESDDPPQRVKARFLLGLLNRGEKLATAYTVPVQVGRFGNELLLIALSGEPVVDWAHTIKRGAWSLELDTKSRTENTPMIWVAGYCNDMFGYLPTRRVQREGGYEGGRANLWSSIPAPFTNDVEDRVTDAVQRLIALVSVNQ
jgi:hypothetical protein